MTVSSLSSMSVLGAQVKTARTDAGMSRAALASVLGVSSSTVGRLETGTVTSLSVAVIDRLVAQFGPQVLPAAWLPEIIETEIESSLGLFTADGVRWGELTFHEGTTARG